MNKIEVHKLNESYSYIDADSQKLQQINNFLKVERPGAFFDPLVKAGMRSPYDFFASAQNNKLLILSGHRELLQSFGVTPDIVQSDYTDSELNTFLDSIKPKLPFPPYDFQEIAFRESILSTKQINKMATGSGKSMTITLIAEFFRKQGKKGLLLVPNINLLTQFKKDIGEYNLSELYADTHVIGGGSTNRHFNSTLTISTWQSLQNWHDDLDSLDYVIVDECLHPGTLISTINGDIKIRDLKKGDLVITINEETGTKEYKQIIKVHKNISSEKMYRITTEDNRVMMITANHKVLTSSGWKRVDELTLDDEIISLGKYDKN